MPPRSLSQRLGRGVALVFLTLAVVAVAFAVLIFGGSIVSGGLFLAVPMPAVPVAHTAVMTPVHKGHVDLATGLYIREDTDVIMTKSIPWGLWRTHLTGDHVSRQFGVGGTSNAEWYLVGDVDKFQWAELILADGGRIRFERTSRGTSYSNARYEHRATATEFFGSQLAWIGLGWALRYRDGSLAWFSDCSPGQGNICALIHERDADGHELRFRRERDGLLREIDGGGESVTFQYDERKRIEAIRQDGVERARYTYDAGGHLATAVTSDGVTRRYTYGAHDELLKVEEPGRSVENTFDASLRLVRQVLRRPDTEDYVMAFAYETVDGKAHETAVTEDGLRTVLRFDAHYDQVYERQETPTGSPVEITLNRGEGGYLRGLTIRCVKDGQDVGETVSAPRGVDPDDFKDSEVDRLCR